MFAVVRRWFGDYLPSIRTFGFSLHLVLRRRIWALTDWLCWRALVSGQRQSIPAIVFGLVQAH